MNPIDRHYFRFRTEYAIVIGAVISMACARYSIGAGSGDIYEYPVKPGTSEWKALHSSAEMLKVCQIPEKLLRRMSTAGLVETVLNYPLYGNIHAHNSLQQGFEAVTSQFNGLQELLKRRDAGTVLLSRYRTMDPAVINRKPTSVEKGTVIWDFENVEILLAQDVILGSFTEKQRQDLIRVTLEKYQAKKLTGESGFSIQPGVSIQCGTALVLGRALLQENYLPFKQTQPMDMTPKDFISKCGATSYSTIEDIAGHTQQFLSTK